MSAIPARVVETGSLWDRAPGLVSLRDLMEKLHPVLPVAVFAQFAHFIAFFARFAPAAPASEEGKANTEAVLFSTVELLCREAGLTHSLAMLERLKSDFALGISNGDARKAVQLLHGVMLNEMQDCSLFLAPKDRVSFYNNPRLFGEAVFDTFPSARMDIREAGNCWLFGRNNAVVYHLMCAAEFGLRALAADRRVPTPRGPLELEQWGTIIGLLETKIADIDQWPRSLLREKVKAKEFYNTALIQARAFNDGYRRHVMHARGHAYEDDETQALMGHVRRFMQMLATRISEGVVGPEVWPATP